MKIHRIKDETYFRDATLVIGTDLELEGWLKRHKRHYPDLHTEWYGVNGRFVKVPNKAGVWMRFVLVSTKNTGHWLTAILGHEIFHLTCDVLQSVGVQLSDESEEAFTYYFRSRFAACLKHI